MSEPFFREEGGGSSNLPESNHKLGQLFLVELGNRSEHPFPRDTTKLGIRHSLLGHTHYLSYKKKPQVKKKNEL